MAIFEKIKLGNTPRIMLTNINKNFSLLNIPAGTTTTTEYGDISSGTDLSTLSLADILKRTFAGSKPLVSQTAIQAAVGGNVELVANKNKPNGYVGLGADGKIDSHYIPLSVGNATQLGGHEVDYFATAANLTATKTELEGKITSAINGLEWRPSVADKAALKAVTTPKEGWTISLQDTNRIYRFDVSDTTAADAPDDSVIKATDGTTGSWIALGTATYTVATETTDGLMGKTHVADLKQAKTNITSNTTKITALEGNFISGAAKNALQLGGKNASEYVLKSDASLKPTKKIFARENFSVEGDYKIYKITLTAGQYVVGVYKEDSGSYTQVVVDLTMNAAGTEVKITTDEEFSGYAIIVG